MDPKCHQSESAAAATAPQQAQPQPQPQPQLLLGLPPLALHTLLGALSSSDKRALINTCRDARAAVLHHAPQLRFKLNEQRGAHGAAGSALCALLSTRTEPLQLALNVKYAGGAAVMHMLEQLATQQYPTQSGSSCVTGLELLMPEDEVSRGLCSWVCGRAGCIH